MSASAQQIALEPIAESQESITLRRGALGFTSLLAQSVAGLAPSTSISVPIVVVAVVSGNGAWLTWLISTFVMLAVAASLSSLSRRFVSAGGLYSLNACGHPVYGAITAWAGLLGCITGGATTPLLFGIFLQSFLTDMGIQTGNRTLLATMILVTVAAGALAWRDTAVSARFVLTIEGLSLLAILSLVGVVLYRHTGNWIDLDQLQLRGVDAHAIAAGLVLGLGAYSGFEASCSFGFEARRPQTEIARSLIGSVGGAGLLFVLCSYVLRLGFHGFDIAASQNSNPWSDLALLNGSPILRYAIQIGVLISVFSMFVTNFNVWSRMLLTLSRERLLPPFLAHIDKKTRTPGVAILAAVLLDIGLQVFLVITGYATRNLYSLICAMSGYWFTSTYVLICAAMLTYQWRSRQLSWWQPLVAAAGAIPLALSIFATYFPLPSFPDSLAPIFFLVSAVAVFLQLFYFARRRPELLNRVGASVEHGAA
jgi:amino acid transporter